MKCEEAEKKMVEFVEGELPAKESKLIAEHISKCKKCRESYTLHLEVERSLKSLRAELPSYGKTISDVYRALGIKRKGIMQRLIQSPVFAALSIVVIGFVAIFFSDADIARFSMGCADRIVLISDSFAKAASATIIDLFGGKVRTLLAVNISLIIFFSFIWSRAVLNFQRHTNGF
ncbi:hypothetical protein DRQ05_02155 [bacterium]|nr:MAG: hypothetical protein DRQ05_02155 [bacterium]